jgi:hypothetical protein
VCLQGAHVDRLTQEGLAHPDAGNLMAYQSLLKTPPNGFDFR